MKRILLLACLLAFATTSFAGPSCTDTIKCSTNYFYCGSTAALTVNTGGGTWSSSNTAVATVGSSTGILAPVTPGTATITYKYNTCTYTKAITVNPISNAPNVVVQKGTATYIIINGSNYKRTSIGTLYNYTGFDSAVSIYNVFTNRTIIPPTTDSNFIYFDSSNKRAHNMLGLRTWLNTNLE